MALGRKLTIAGLVLCVLSLVLQALGCACPGWLVTVIYLHVIGAVLGTGISGYGELKASVAVWYGRVCVDASWRSETCDLSTDHDARHYGYRVTTALNALADIDWTLIRILVSVAMFACCLGVFLAAASLVGRLNIPRRLLTTAAALSMLASGVLVIPACIEVGTAITEADRATSEQNDSIGHELVDIKVPWALILSGIGVVLAFLAAIILLLATCMEKPQKSLGITPESTEFLFDVAITKVKSDTSLVSSTGQGPGPLPRIGQPDTESLVFENVPFRPLKLSSFREPNAASCQEKGGSDADQAQNSDQQATQQTLSEDQERKLSNGSIGGRSQQSKKSKTEESNSNMSVAKGVPASRHMQFQNKHGRNSRDISGNRNQKPPVFTVSPFTSKLKPPGANTSSTREDKGKKGTQPVMDIYSLYSQSLTQGKNSPDQMTNKNSQDPLTKASTKHANVREDSKDSW